MKTKLNAGNLAVFLELIPDEMTPERFEYLLKTGIFSDIFDQSATFDDRNKWRDAFGLEKIDLDKNIPRMDCSTTLFHSGERLQMTPRSCES